jgi:CRP-like cAMP-binding protein
MKVKEKTAESGRIVLMLTIGFFTGIFVATLDVGASTLFLDRFDEQAYLPKAIVTSGLLGIVFTYLFAYLQTKVKFTSLSVFFILLIIALTTCIRLGVDYEESHDLVIFCAFACIGPFTTVVFLIFWGLFGRIFSLRESKKMISRIDSGQLLASIVALFTIPVVLTFLPHTVDLLWISATSVTLILVTLLILKWKYNLNDTHIDLHDENQPDQSVSVKNLIKNRYVIQMAILVIISTIAIYLLNYSFLSVTAEQFPDTRHLANFISIFTGTVVIFNFIIQNFVTDRIVNMYGLKVALLINPVLFCFFTFLSSIIGSYIGHTRISESFILFFLSVALSKLFAVSLKDALDNPTFKLYLLPLDTSARFNVQARIEGVVTMFAVCMAGGLLWLLKYLAFLDLIWFTYALVPIVICWLLAVTRLYSHYRATLERSLEKSKKEVYSKNKKTYLLDILFKNTEYLSHPLYPIVCLKLIERVEPSLLTQALATIQEVDSAPLQAYVQKRQRNLSVGVNIFSNRQSDQEGAYMEITSAGSKVKFNSFGLSAVQKLARSATPSERIISLQLLSKIINADNVFLLTELLRDTDTGVKKEAIAVAMKVKRPETWPILIELLSVSSCTHAAARALIESGNLVLNVLEMAFHKTGQSTPLLQKIINIYGQIGTPEAAELLWEKIEYPDAKVATEVLLALNECQLQTGSKVAFVQLLVEQEIGKAAWNQAALLEIADAPYNRYLQRALEEEMLYNFERIFLLLSLIYDPRSIQLVKENIESGSSESKVYALELLDVFIDKHLKTILFPLLDDIPAAEEVSIYQAYFPRETLDSTEVLLHILNREFNAINRWTKACAIYSLAHTPQAPLSNELIAHIFNPDPLLRETAAWAIYCRDLSLYTALGSRIKASSKIELDMVLLNKPVLSGKLDISGMLMHRVLFLKKNRLLMHMPNHVLADIAENIRIFYFRKGEVIIDAGQKTNTPLYIIFSGTARSINEDSYQETVFSVHDLIGEIMILENDINSFDIIATEEVYAYAIEKEIFYRLISYYPETGNSYALLASRLTSSEQLPVEDSLLVFS